MKRHTYQHAAAARFVVWTTAALLSAALMAGCGDSRRGLKGNLERMGQSKPFTLNNLAGESRTYEEYAKSEAMILCFFESTQPTSMNQIKTIETIFKRHRGGIAAAAVAVDADLSAVRAFAENQNLTIDILTGEREAIRTVADDYGGANYLPTTFVILAGNISKRFTGDTDEEQLEAVLPEPPEDEEEKEAEEEKKNA